MYSDIIFYILDVYPDYSLVLTDDEWTRYLTNDSLSNCKVYTTMFREEE